MKRIERSIQIILLVIFIYYSQFYKLGTLAYRIWDEARLATNAYEMTKTGNLVVTTIGYEPDMWNTKPPMMIWAQAVCIKLHGINEFSTRFPAALCAALTIILVFAFVLRVTKNGWAALTAATVLCTAKGYIGYHGTRYGEYDSMLTLFTSTYLLAFFIYTEETILEKKNKYLLLFFFALILASLTKGIAALLFSPALLIYVIARKQFVDTLKNKYFYIGATCFLLIVLSYYFLREHYNSGYLKAVFDNELGGRFLAEVEEHSGPPDFYYENLKWERFSSWYWLLPTGLILLATHSALIRFRAVSFSFISAVAFLIIISIGKTKLGWYDLPTYPLFSIIIGITVYQIGNILGNISPYLKKETAIILFCLIASAQPVYEAYNMVKYSGDDLDKDSFYSISYFLRSAANSNKDLNGVTYLTHLYNWQWLLYIDQLKEKGTSIQKEDYNELNKFHVGQKIIANQEHTKEYIEANYPYVTKEEFHGTKLYEITGDKKSIN